MVNGMLMMMMIMMIIIIIIFINCNLVITRWQWLFHILYVLTFHALYVTNLFENFLNFYRILA